MILFGYVIGVLLVSLAGGYVLRMAGQTMRPDAPLFRDMSLGVAFGYALGILVLLGGIYIYFTVQNPFFRWAVHGFIFFAIIAYLFRLLGRSVGSQGSKKLFRQMPLTAAFGIAVILFYAFMAVFAGQISIWVPIFIAIISLPIRFLAQRNMTKDGALSVDIVAAVIFFVFLAMYFVGPIAPHGQEEVFARANVVPGGDPALGGDPAFPLGTDQIGRDILSRLIYGAQNTVGIAFATTCLAFLIGITFGFLAAIKGGWIDQLCSRVVDALMAIPQLIFALLLMTIATAWAGSDKQQVTLYMIVIIAVLDSTRVYRLSRAVGLNIVVMDYIEAAKLRGESLNYLIFREILPNAYAPLLAEFGLRFCFVFLTIASLSFLGVGIQPPLADWGTMVRDLSQFVNYAQFAPQAATVPLLAAGAIALLTVGVNFVVDWMLHKSSGLKE